MSWDHLGLTGVTGFASWLGNLVVMASDQQQTGVAIYDVSGFKTGQLPRLLSTYQPILTEPDGNQTGIGGYWVEPYGTNKLVWAARRKQSSIPKRNFPAMFIVDFTDPTDPQMTCELYFNQDRNDPSDGDSSSDPMYVNFQDNFAFVDHFKVDIAACEAAYADGQISPAEFNQIVYRFDDIANNCEGSQYFRPLGQVGVFGGYDFWETQSNEQGMCFMVTSNTPDTKPPYVSGHRPLAGQNNYPVDGFIHLHIPETLRTETVVNAVTVRNVSNNQAISFRHQLSHTGTLSIWPDQDFALNTTYQVDVTGIKDFMGNTMNPYSFRFTTGNQVLGTPVPDPVVDTGNPPPPPIVEATYYPNQSSQLACEPEVDNGNVWVVNPDNDSVAIIDRRIDSGSLVLTAEVSREIKTNYEHPTSVTKVNNLFAVTYRDDDKIVLYDSEGNPVRSIDSGHGTQPIASVAAGSNLYVALYGSGEVIKINATSGRIQSRLKVGPKPKAMALAGNRLLVTRYISTSDRGEVYDINTAGSMRLTRKIPVNKILIPDDLDHGSGVPNYLSSIVISPDGNSAYISAVKANIDRGLFLNGQPLDDDNTVRPIIVTLDLINHRDLNTDPNHRWGTIDLDNAADPAGITFLPDGVTRVHTLQGNNLVVYNNLEENKSANVAAGFAPQSMCTTPSTLYVKNFTDRTVSAIDTSGWMSEGTQNPDIKSISSVAIEKLNNEELRGLKLFYQARKPDLSPEGYISCASCHSGGGHDGMTWDVTHMGEGLRNTLSLNGASGTRFGDLHWSGNFDEVQDFEIQLEKLNGGEGLIPGVTFTTQSPITHVTGGRSGDLDALATYVNSLGKDRVKRSPYRTYTGSLSAAAERGRDVFSDKGCADCHAGSAFRDGQMHDVGTINAGSGDRLGINGGLIEIRTPSLIELWETGPYFHDGSAATLSDVFNIGDHAVDLTSSEESDLIEYLLSIDRELYIDDDAVFPDF